MESPARLPVREYPVDPRIPEGDLSCSPLNKLSALTPRMRLSFAAGLFWMSVAFCVVAQYLIVRSVLRTHHVPEPGAPPMPRQRGWVELLWALAPAVGLGVLLFFTWRAVQRNSVPSPLPPSSAVQLPA